MERSHSVKLEFGQRRYNDHKERVRNAKSSIDDKAPPSYSHVQLKLKKLQLEDERLASIGKENWRIMKQLTSIMHNHSSVDCYNDYEHKSLNAQQRKNEALQIVHDNEKIVNRLLAIKPQHDRAALEHEWTEREALLKRISKHNHKWRQPDKKHRETHDGLEPLNLTQFNSNVHENFNTTNNRSRRSSSVGSLPSIKRRF